MKITECLWFIVNKLPSLSLNIIFTFFFFLATLNYGLKSWYKMLCAPPPPPPPPAAFPQLCGLFVVKVDSLSTVPKFRLQNTAINKMVSPAPAACHTYIDVYKMLNVKKNKQKKQKKKKQNKIDMRLLFRKKGLEIAPRKVLFFNFFI